MGFYREPIQLTASQRGVTRVARSTTKVRVASGGLGSIQTLIASRLPGYKPPTTTTTTQPSGQQGIQSLIASRLPGYKPPTTQPTISFRIPTGAPTPTTPTTPRTFSPVSPAPSPTPVAPLTTTPAPAITTGFSPVSPAPGTPTPIDSGALLPGFTPTETSSAGVTGSGSASGGTPATYNTPTTIRFDSSVPLTMPDASGGPEIYNEDGTPVTPAAQAAASTLSEKLKKLPTAAKIGGAVLAYLLLHG